MNIYQIAGRTYIDGENGIFLCSRAAPGLRISPDTKALYLENIHFISCHDNSFYYKLKLIYKVIKFMW